MVFGNGYVIEGQKHAAHVTGIPFTMTTSSNADGWSISGPSDWNKNGGFRMGYGLDHGSTAATSATKTFHMPANTNVAVESNGAIRGSANVTTTTFNLYVSGTSIFSTSRKKGSDESWSVSETATMTSGTPTIKLQNSNATYTCSTTIKYLRVTYAL